MVDTHHHVQLIFVFLVETGLHHVGQSGIELLNSSDPPALASQVLGLQATAPSLEHYLTIEQLPLLERGNPLPAPLTGA